MTGSGSLDILAGVKLYLEEVILTLQAGDCSDPNLRYHSQNLGECNYVDKGLFVFSKINTGFRKESKISERTHEGVLFSAKQQ